MKQQCTNAIRKYNARSGSELFDELDEEAVTMLFEIFRSQIGELLLRFDVRKCHCSRSRVPARTPALPDDFEEVVRLDLVDPA